MDGSPQWANKRKCREEWMTNKTPRSKVPKRNESFDIKKEIHLGLEFMPSIFRIMESLVGAVTSS